MPANPHCPVKGKQACTGPLCGHCRGCKLPLDMHDGLSIPAKPVKCPRY